MRITIYSLSKDAFDEVTRDLTDRWYTTINHPDNDYHVVLNDNVIISNGIDCIWLNLAGHISKINASDYYKIEIY